MRKRAAANDFSGQRKDEGTRQRRADRWAENESFHRLTSGRIESVAALASEEVSAGYVTRAIQLALMAPDIVECIVRGEQPIELTSVKLMQSMPLPPDWAAQRRMLGFG